MRFTEISDVCKVCMDLMRVLVSLASLYMAVSNLPAIMGEVWSLGPPDVPECLRHKSLTQHEQKIASLVMVPEDVTCTFNDIGGYEHLKQELLVNVCLPFMVPELDLEANDRVLLHGPPGTGKTTLAACVAKAMNIPLLCVSPSVLEDKYYGESAKYVQALFSLASKMAPCVVFFDEIDSMLRNRSMLDDSASYSMKSDLLVHLDGVKKCKGVVFMAATNHLDALDKALLRRLPLHLHVELPGEEARRHILQLHASKHGNRLIDGALQTLVQRTKGMSGSDIESMLKQHNTHLQKKTILGALRGAALSQPRSPPVIRNVLPTGDGNRSSPAHS